MRSWDTPRDAKCHKFVNAACQEAHDVTRGSTRSRDALDAARRGPCRVFFRDDDAGWGDARLRRAARPASRELRLPVDLAVIPAELDAGLARELRRAAGGVGLHQHGLAHVNHERDGPQVRVRARARARPLSGATSRRAASGCADLLGDARRPDLHAAVEPLHGRRPAAASRSSASRCSRARRARRRSACPACAELPVSVDWFAHRHGVRLSPAELGARIAARDRRRRRRSA